LLEDKSVVLDLQNEFAVLEETLKTECGRGPVYYFPNPGNWGDGLIRLGTIKFFDDINLKYKELTRRKKSCIIPWIRGGTVIYGGGAGWCKIWTKAPKYVARFKPRCKVIVLPSTYESTYSIPNTVFFCRDKYESQQYMPGAVFCHDMAFYLRKLSLDSGKGSGKGYFFRTDKESAGKIKLPPGNNDISLKGNYLSNMTPFLEGINRFEVIYTDRLHVAIAACLLGGKEVHLYQSSFFKIPAIYMSSMKDVFDNLFFHEDFDFNNFN
jgi:Polysaccharide pyruvyl transferase